MTDDSNADRAQEIRQRIAEIRREIDSPGPLGKTIDEARRILQLKRELIALQRMLLKSGPP
jgi:hypothetical protein